MRRAATALLLAAASAAQAQGDWAVGGSVGVAQRELRERAASGATLLTERRPLLAARVHATRAWSTGAALQGACSTKVASSGFAH